MKKRENKNVEILKNTIKRRRERQYTKIKVLEKMIISAEFLITEK